jgi:hypothetical protein
MVPELLIVQYHHNGGYSYHTVNIVWSKSTITYGQRKFMTLKDALNWCDQEYYQIPIQ